MTPSISQHIDMATFKQWLDETKQLDSFAASNAIYKYAGVLNKQVPNLAAADLKQMTATLTVFGLHLLTTLEKAYLKNQQHKIAQLYVGLSRRLANLHMLTAPIVSERDKSLNYNCALQLQGMAHYQSVLSYDRPSSTLWEEMGMAYQAALNLKISDETVAKLPEAFKALDTINKVIRRNLLFSVCQAYSLLQTDIQALFQFCNQHQHHLQLDRIGETSREGFYWGYTDTQLPRPLYSATTNDRGMMFNVEPLFQAHRHGQIQWPMNPTPLLLVLSRYKAGLKTNSVALPNHHVFVCGREMVMEFFNAHVRGGKASSINSPTPEKLNFSNLELVQEEKRKENRVDSMEIWGAPKTEKIKLGINDFGALKTYKTDLTGFYSCEAIKAKLFDQDLLVLYGNDLKPRMAIVQRLDPEALPTSRKAILEIIEGTATGIRLFPNATNEQIGVLISGQSQQLIINPQKITTTHSLPSSVGAVRLDRLLQITPNFLRYQVSVSAPE